ncbi:MAG: glycosyltransferase family 9 protein [candidate division FCPU426 bacterium]
MNDQPRRWLVCRTDALGDSLLALPVAAAIKRLVPGSHVACLVSDYTREIFAGHPDVDEVLAYEAEGAHAGRRGFRRLVELIASRKFDAGLLVFPDARVSWAVWRAGVRQRVGTGRRLWSWLYTTRVPHSRAKAERHEADYNLDLLRALGLSPVLEPPRLSARPEDLAWAQADLRQRGLEGGQRLVVIHPGGRGSSANWSLENYRQLAGLLLADPDTRVLVTGAGLEQERNAAVFAAAWVLRETIRMPQLAALIARADAVVAGNTGPAHLAAALGRPVVALYPSAGVTGQVRWRPLGERVEVLGLDGLEPETAAQAVRKAIRSGK